MALDTIWERPEELRLIVALELVIFEMSFKYLFSKKKKKEKEKKEWNRPMVITYFYSFIWKEEIHFDK